MDRDRHGNPDDVASAASLMVDRFWYPRVPDIDGPWVLGNYSLRPVADGVWVSASTETRSSREMLFHVGIEESQPDFFHTSPPVEPPGIFVQEMVATPDALFVLGEPMDDVKKSIMARYDFLSQQWQQHDVPSSDRLFQAAGHLYLSLNGQGVGEFEGGIARYDEQTGESTVLASSRRRPAQNQFDDRSVYSVQSVFTGPGNKPCVCIGFGETYVISETPGNWPHLIDSGQAEFMRTDGNRTILYGPRSFMDKSLGDVVFMIDPSKAKPELWLGAPVPSWGTEVVGQAGSAPSPWPQPPVWPQPAGGVQSAAYGFRGADLFCYVTDTSTLKNELVWYRRGTPEPVHIPLVFKMSDEQAEALQEAEKNDPFHDQRYQESTHAGLHMDVGSTGIFFSVQTQGFYFLPYSEIDTYLKAHAAPR